MLKVAVFVVMVTNCASHQIILWIIVASKDLYTYFEIPLHFNSNVIYTYLCGHGNRVSIATNYTMNCCCLKGRVCQICFYRFKQQCYVSMCLCCHSNQMSITTNKTKRSHTQLDSRKQIIVFQDGVTTTHQGSSTHTKTSK